MSAEQTLGFWYPIQIYAKCVWQLRIHKYEVFGTLLLLTQCLWVCKWIVVGCRGYGKARGDYHPVTPPVPPQLVTGN